MRKTDPSQAHFICCLGAASLMLIVLLRCPMHAQGFQAARRLPGACRGYLAAMLSMPCRVYRPVNLEQVATACLLHSPWWRRCWLKIFTTRLAALRGATGPDRQCCAIRAGQRQPAAAGLPAALPGLGLGWGSAVQDVRQPDSDDECPAHHRGRSGMLTRVGGPFQTVRLGRQSAPLTHLN